MDDAAFERRGRTRAWLEEQPEPLTRAEALRRRLGAWDCAMAADGSIALVSLRPGTLCFISREMIEGNDETLQAHAAAESFHGFGDLFVAHEPMPALTDEQLSAVDFDTYKRRRGDQR